MMKSRISASAAKSTAERKIKTVDYIVVILALVMVGLYALAIGWLLPKH